MKAFTFDSSLPNAVNGPAKNKGTKEKLSQARFRSMFCTPGSLIWGQYGDLLPRFFEHVNGHWGEGGRLFLIFNFLLSAIEVCNCG